VYLPASVTIHASTTSENKVITETAAREPNLWEGIYFYPDAAPDSKFMATTIEHRKTKTIGLFPTLEGAVTARQTYLQGIANE
jgi:hypothetical protein